MVKDYVKNAFAKVSKGIGLQQKLSCSLPRAKFLIIYKSFIRSYLDQSHIINYQPHYESFTSKTEPTLSKKTFHKKLSQEISRDIL